MKNIILLFLFLIPVFLFAQYPATGNKSRLGYQTTGDGLIWRGVAADTAIKPRTTANAYFQLDTVNRVLRRYIATQGSWQVVGGSSASIDSLIYATRYWVGSNFFPLEGGTLTGTGGAGFIGLPSQGTAPGTPASGLNIFAQGSSFNWKGTDGFERQITSSLTGGRNYALPDINGTFALGTGTTDRSARWTGTNTLGAGSWSDNLTRLQAQVPVQFQSVTTAGLPTGVTGYTVYNTTLNGIGWYDGTRWNYVPKADRSAFTSGSIPFTNSSGQFTEDNANLFFDDANDRIAFGTTTPGFDVTLRKTRTTGAVQYSVENVGSGSAAWAGYRLINNTGAVAALFKLSAGYSTYKNQAANDFGFINTTNGNMSFLNDVSGANITFLTGSGGTAQMTLESDGDLFLTGKLGVGLTPAQKVDIRQDQNASTRVNISNQNTGNAAWAGISVGNSTGGGSFYKLSSGYTTYKTQGANDLGFINTVSGNISILNDWASGKVILTGGASTTQHFSVEANGRVVIGNVTPQRLFHVEGEARITDLTTDTPTRIIGADADGDLGELSIAGGLSISGGVLTGANGIYSGSGTLSQTNTYAAMDAAGTKSFGVGYLPNFNGGFTNYGEYGIIASLDNYGFIGMQDYTNNRAVFVTVGDALFDTNSFISGYPKQTSGIQHKRGRVTIRGGLNTESDKYFLLTIDTSKFEITRNIAGALYSYNLVPNDEYPSTTSATKTVLQWTGDGSNANPAFVEVKRDTTIYVTADTDYDFSAAVTTAQIASRYNRIIIHMTLTSGVGADKTTTLHAPDANLMQCEILIRGTDNTGTYDNEIAFGTNNAISSDGTNTSGYTLAQGQGLHVRVVYNGSSYKYIYY